MKKLCFLVLCILILQSSALLAASGVVSSNKMDITVKFGKNQENITCIQDAREPKQWYYVPNKPRLAEDKNGNPIFMIVSYQKNKKAGVDEDGGVLQAAVNLSLQADTLEQLKKEIGKSENIDYKKIKLAPLDMKSAKISVYAPGGEKMATAITAPALGPSFSNEAVPIQMTLTKLGVPVVEALVKGTGGLQVFFQFEYDALTPECSLKVTANWDQMFKHFSTQTKAVVKYSGWFYSGSAKTDISTARNELVKNSCIKIESIGGAALSDEQIDKYLEPLLEKINKAIFDLKEPEKVEPAKAADVDTGSGRFSGGVSFALKSEQERKKGSYVFDMSRRHNIVRTTMVGGIIGLGDYSKEVREAAILTVDPTYWKSAYYSLPNISKRLSGIDEITLAVNFLYKGKQAEGTEQQIAKWAPKVGWTDIDGNEVISLAFPLKYFYDKYSSKSASFADDITYKQSFEITYMEGNNTKIKKFADVLPAFTGDIPVSSPMVGVTYIELEADEDALTWARDTYEEEDYDGIKSDLSKIGVSLTTAGPTNKGTATLTPKNPYASFWFNKDKDGILPDVKAVYTFYSTKLAKALETKDKKTIIIEKEDALAEGPSITFTNNDYLPADKPEGLK